MDSLDELLLVRGVTPELFFGNDVNRNGIIDQVESAGESLLDSDMQLGWINYVTLYSKESNLTDEDLVRININNPDLEQLYDDLRSTFDEQWSLFIVMARVNGIFMRELATFFQLVPNNDGILCINDSTAACTTENFNVFDEMEAYFDANGITDADYDIGHAFTATTTFLGLSGFGSLCNDDVKHRGLSGLPDPIGYDFSVNVVSHELGFQLSGPETIRDCDGIFVSEGNEPGSGST